MVDTFAASDPWRGHDAGMLLIALFVAATTFMALATYLGSRLAPETRRRYTPPRVLRDMSLLAIAAAVALYVWGLLHIVLVDEQEQAEECELRRPEGIPSLVGRRGDFFPLRAVCEGSNGQDYTILVPDYITPSHAALLTLAALCAAASAALHRRRHVTPDPGPDGHRTSHPAGR
ncbi:hypothetical protein [Streptomyces sp. NPDC001930]|uniref:hypothetical protein n=1 Tax=Streptomyces sp. NPDC001930 TaxID=3364625 RepID=UPI0036A16781